MPDLLIALSQFSATLTPGLILMSMASIFIAGVLRGFTGFGFALAAVPLLGLFMPPTQAVPVAIGLQLIGSLLDFRSSAKACDWRSLRWLTLGAVIGSPIGALILSDVSAPVSRLVISSITLAAVAVLGSGFALTTVPAPMATSAVGFLAGVFNGIAAMPGPPAVAYYMSAPMPSRATRASLLVFFLLTSITATITSVAIGLITLSTIFLSLLGLPAMWMGTRVGEYGFARGSDQLHRRVSIVSLGVIAMISAAKAIGELT